MKEKRFIVLVLFLVCIANLYVNAQQAPSHNQCELQDIEPTSIRDTLIRNDSIIVIHTVCAPICSSCVQVYDQKGELIGRIKSPVKTAFPEAYIEEGKILWRDNDTLDYTPAP
jgi:hypothetical protein